MWSPWRFRSGLSTESHASLVIGIRGVQILRVVEARSDVESGAQAQCTA